MGETCTTCTFAFISKSQIINKDIKLKINFQLVCTTNIATFYLTCEECCSALFFLNFQAAEQITLKHYSYQ